ncbi:MAG TPA: hypothetical protein VKU60_04940, partial [Chloroflexota bacterium]|nr:hypothetical protein [Chloroflexota bacterium]
MAPVKPVSAPTNPVNPTPGIMTAGPGYTLRMGDPPVGQYNDLYQGRMISVAHTPDQIKAYQTKLSQISSPVTGRPYYQGKVDGRQNTGDTIAAVVHFQSDYNLASDGLIGVSPYGETGPAIDQAHSMAMANRYGETAPWAAARTAPPASPAAAPPTAASGAETFAPGPNAQKDINAEAERIAQGAVKSSDVISPTYPDIAGGAPGAPVGEDARTIGAAPSATPPGLPQGSVKTGGGDLGATATGTLAPAPAGGQGISRALQQAGAASQAASSGLTSEKPVGEQKALSGGIAGKGAALSPTATPGAPGLEPPAQATVTPRIQPGGTPGADLPNAGYTPPAGAAPEAAAVPTPRPRPATGAPGGGPNFNEASGGAEASPAMQAAMQASARHPGVTQPAVPAVGGGAPAAA